MAIDGAKATDARQRRITRNASTLPEGRTWQLSLGELGCGSVAPNLNRGLPVPRL